MRWCEGILGSRKGKAIKYLLVAWISQLYIASMMRGLQSKKPAEMPSRTSLIDSPVSRPMSSSSPALDCTDRSSKNTATPCMGSWHRGPWPVASWKAYAILSLKSRTSSAWWLSPSICCLVSSTKLERKKMLDMNDRHSAVWTVILTISRRC